MAKRTRKTAAPSASATASSRAPSPSPYSPRLGWRWHPARLRMALWLLVVAAGFAATFGQSSALVMWFLRDAYVATRATVVKAPYWADGLSKEPDPYGAVAGWHVDLSVAGKPFTLAVALADFDPDRSSTQQTAPPDAARFAPGTLHPVWFMDDQRRIAPRTVAVISEPPPVLIGRAAFASFPTLSEAVDNSTGALTPSAVLLVIACPCLILAFFGGRVSAGKDVERGTRISVALVALLIAAGIFMINREHPMATQSEQYVPAEIEMVTAPFPVDQLTHYAGYRVLWRTWRVEAKLVNPEGPSFIIDVDGLDPHRVSWASRHTPDFDAFAPGTRMKVWQSRFHGSALEGTVLGKPLLHWETFLSRERWPEHYTLTHFMRDAPQATAFIALCVGVALVSLLPLGGARRNT